MLRLLPIALSLGVACAAWAHPTTAPRPAAPRVRAKPPVKKIDAGEGSPWLGIGIEPGKRGVKVNQVIDGAPAQLAGVQVGDEVLAINRRAVLSPEDLIARIGEFKTGVRVKVEIARGGRRLTVTPLLTARLDDQELLERHLLDKPAPAFEAIVVASDADAKPETVSLSTLRGKVVIIEFLATWCEPCKSTYPTLGALQAKRRADGLVVLGISEESEASLRALGSQKRLGFPLARDVGSAARTAYQPKGVPIATPTFFVIDRQGVVRFVGRGAGVTLDHAIFAAERALGSGAD